MTHSTRIIALIALALFLGAAAARAAVIRCADAASFPGGEAAVTVSLEHTEEEVIAGTQNDLSYDDAVFSADPETDCVIDPAIGAGTDANKGLASSHPFGDLSVLRNIIFSLTTVRPIPSGDLYTCTLHVAADAALGDYAIVNSNLVASDPNGVRLPVTGGDCVVAIGPTPTPTPRCRRDEDCPDGQVCVDGECVDATPTPTNTVPTATATATATKTPRCRDNMDCPSGEVCVDGECVTATPTRTGTVTATPQATATATPLCRENSDCPDGEVCVDGTCVTATPTATPPKRKKGGGGCSCEIDPGAGPRAEDVLAIVVPAFVLLLRWRSRRTVR